jgi:hypothetical protein
MARGTSSSSSSSSEEDDAESSTSEMLSESEPLEEDDESGSEEDENLGRINLGPRRVVHRDATLKDHWKQTLSAVDSVKEKIPSWTYVKLVDFIKDEWSNCR